MYHKLYGTKSNGKRNTSKWRKCKFIDIVSIGIKDQPLLMDQIYYFKMDKKTLKIFREFNGTPNDDASIMFLVIFDVIMTSIVDTFGYGGMLDSSGIELDINEKIELQHNELLDNYDIGGNIIGSFI